MMYLIFETMVLVFDMEYLMFGIVYLVFGKVNLVPSVYVSSIVRWVEKSMPLTVVTKVSNMNCVYILQNH